MGLLLVASACSEKKGQDLNFQVEFTCPDDREAADQLRLRVTKGSCNEPGEVVYEATLAKGDTAPAGNGIDPGSYAFSAVALRAEQGVASTCIEVELPAAEPPLLALRSADCQGVVDPDASIIDSDAMNPDPGTSMDAGADATEAGDDAGPGESDAAPDADASEDANEDAGEAQTDAALADAGVDAGPIPCATDCKDSFPCTEDRCVNGECVHDPYTGTRECDSIACTQNDKCESGSCKAGTATNSACPDDGNPCTTETCVVGTGCNRQNSTGNSCNDQIGCTGPDKCANGVCRGVDMCSTGVCSAVTRMCSMCSSPSDCDDGNACTTDACSTGACTHTTKTTGACDDGKSCTNNDTCTATGCVGTSTCPSGATCGGSTCSCSDSSLTLCDDTSVNPAVQVCVNLTSNANSKFCDSCDRKCADGSACENRACKPSSNTGSCTAWRDNGHDYLVCSNTKTWPEARDQCRAWGLGLVIIDSSNENEFLRGKSGNVQHWTAANDRGDNGSVSGFGSNGERECTKRAEEGTWYWARPSSSGNNNADDNFRGLCSMANDTATTCTLSTGPNGGSSYQNWPNPQPDNAGCNCSCSNLFCNNGCSEGEDCGSLLGDGTWNDAPCGSTMGFICESP